MIKIKCCICGDIPHKEVFVIKKKKLVRCLNCDLLFFNNFKQKGYESYDIMDYQKNLRLFYYYQGIIADIISRCMKKGALFEIGAGVGILMDIMEKKGWKVSGIDASKEGVDFAKKTLKIKIKRGDFLKQDIQGKYNIVVSNHVIEHVYDPNLFLKKAYKILDSKGLLVLGLPNAGCLEFKIFGKAWISLAPEQHIWHFSPKTIKKILEKNNFKIIKVMIEQPKREFSTLPKKMIGHALYEPFRFFMNLLGTGSNMFVVAVKNEQ